MTEPKGIIFEVAIREIALKKFLNHRLPTLPAQMSGKSFPEHAICVMDLFTNTLYLCEDSTQGIFLLNYKKEEGQLFCAYILKNYDSEAIAHFSELLNILSSYLESEKPDYAIITSLVPEVEKGYAISKNNLKKISSNDLKRHSIDRLLDRFWSFKKQNDFPAPDKAFRLKNYFY